VGGWMFYEGNHVVVVVVVVVVVKHYRS
jgi:hypothetical protein